jgi:prepilin-type N-terminal cleavage/methylation domain-containing protein/prepilin-type processing-associated H-X9-DG protein
LSRAFTLVELLVVVAIIIILAACLFPVLEQAAKKSEGATCLSNLSNLAMGAGLYADDWDDYLPPALVPALPRGYSTCWDRTLQPYLHNSELCVCLSDGNPTPGPSFTYSYTHSYGLNLAVTMLGGYQCASLRRADLSNPSALVLLFDLKQPYSYGWDASWGNATQYVAERHLGGANFAFCGGNCQWMHVDATLQGAGRWQP